MQKWKRKFVRNVTWNNFLPYSLKYNKIIKNQQDWLLDFNSFLKTCKNVEKRHKTMLNETKILQYKIYKSIFIILLISGGVIIILLYNNVNVIYDTHKYVNAVHIRWFSLHNEWKYKICVQQKWRLYMKNFQISKSKYHYCL